MALGYRPPFQRRRFTSPMREKLLKTRELYYSLLTVLVVEIVLFAYLCAFFGLSLKVMRRSFRTVNDAWRIGLPAAIAIIAAIVGWIIYKNIKKIIRLDAERREKSDRA